MSKARGDEKVLASANGGWTLQNSYQPGMSLVALQLTGSNYLSWSLAVTTAFSLEAKNKLGFVDETIKTSKAPTEFKKWKPVDSMDSIAERYSVSNGPKFYQIQRQVASLEQGSKAVTGYFNKMNRGQIMNLDLLPSVNKEFFHGGFARRSDDKKADKNAKYCDHCNQSGHTREACFKIIGFPDWYKNLKEQKKKAGKRNVTANAVADTLMEFAKDKENIDLAGVLTALQEITKTVKIKIEEQVNFANLGEFVGKTAKHNPTLIDDCT
ncbi:uncharacterized protein G2W53_037036 [Senna tora]|uniref:Retrotransposon Copia-like N-terminal domain-containing protein n=1 Tax=Senna tora TaxID=362788 RepID=A0A834STM0_9FABA|nr:uncharacterized protein G2W53_037036 [Senna tora]